MKAKKIILTLFSVVFIGIFCFTYSYKSGIILNSLGIHIENPFAKRVIVPDDSSKIDKNKNGIPDAIDIVNAARREVKKRTKYHSAYYAGGYPPEDEGVCTDVIWRGLLEAGINLKELMDNDIQRNLALYPRLNGKPEPNIDFRRVPNQYVYFERFTESLTTELIPKDIENLRQWQPGDIIVFLEGIHHVAIISDRRAKDGTPYILHNSPPFAVEIKLKSISTPIAGHYRWKY